MQVYWGSEGRPTEGPFREPAFSPISSTNNKHSCEKSSCGCWRLGLCLHQGWPRGDHTWKQTLSSENARVCWTQPSTRGLGKRAGLAVVRGQAGRPLRGGHDHGIPDAGVAQVQMQNRDVQSGGAAQPGRRLLAKETRV